MPPVQSPFPLSCVIFAGGKSSRMGRNKALLPFGGSPTMARYQFERLSPLFTRTFLSVKQPHEAFSGMPQIPDAEGTEVFAPKRRHPVHRAGNHRGTAGSGHPRDRCGRRAYAAGDAPPLRHLPPQPSAPFRNHGGIGESCPGKDARYGRYPLCRFRKRGAVRQPKSSA